ncbi:MAG: BON domain-containing protein [Pirellulales bacterium]|nr:BON domain-containing protein [Pirellulales bacterium]
MQTCLRLSLLLGLFAFHNLAFAQFSGGTINGGGASGIGSSGIGGGGIGSSGIGGSSGLGGSSSGRSTSGAFGNRSLGSSSTGGANNTFGGTQRGGLNQQQGQFGQNGGLGQNRQGQQRQFVGADSGDFANFFGSVVGAQQAAFQGMARQNNMNQGNQQNQGNQGNARSKKTVRAIRTVQFEFASPQPEVLTTTLSTRLNRTKSLSRLSGDIQVQMDGRTAILTGVVKDQRQRDLAERLCLLEPGVSKVQNDLTLPEEVPVPPVR